jgi:hypothetical protein
MRATLYMAIAVALLISVVPASGVRANAEEPARETPAFAWYRLIVPFGIGTLSLMVLTFLAGWFMRVNRKLLFNWHRRLAIATLIAASCHLLLVILFR